MGYVSGDFRKHVMDRMIEALLRDATKGEFELFAYDNSARSDEVTERLKGYGATWRPIRDREDREVADAIRADKIDVLVDLSGITAGHRLGVFARRPAPVQLTWAGYLPTTGAKFFDWKLCDATSGLQQEYTEPLHRIPEGIVMGPLEGAPPVGAAPHRANGYITFGCVNSWSKVNRECLDAWVEILRKVPTARLIVVFGGSSEQNAALAVLRRFGSVQDRVMLTEWQTGHRFPRVFTDIDIALNTHPYGGCATSFDTLWQGTPIVCLAGDRTVGRYAAHFQRKLNLDQFIAPDWKGYVSAAIGAAHRLTELDHIRSSLRDRMKAAGMLDTVAWVRSVEDTYRNIWRKHCEQH